ncbi:hypothetical protein J437_LFUL008776 [Ladona fulva]|uniref:Transposable element P transposase-like RNase H C-terminal domain-containing protein n=1 Tax=Ladona fulva TaxID=123851 RepID=A0A8K0K1X8_LADFU|nr:hypothetical protein J437_LFUL008776 [Ladona fulva]
MKSWKTSSSQPFSAWVSVLEPGGPLALPLLDKPPPTTFVPSSRTLTIRSNIFIWNRLNNFGFKFLHLKTFNQEQLVNAFCCIQQHGIANTNPTCSTLAALKTCIINNMALPFQTMSNCDKDD